MEQFERAKTVRLRSSHGKYLWADEDMVGVSQERDSGERAVWQVELVEDGSEDAPSVVRLKSAFGGYLTASDESFLLGMTGKKVLQMKRGESSTWLESWIEWEPVAEPHSTLVKMRTRHGNYLRGNGLIPPWRNSVTHDVPVRTATQSWVLWGVEVVESTIQKAHSPPDLQQKIPSRNHEMKQQLSFKIPVSDGRRISYTVVSDAEEEIVGSEKDWPWFYFKGHTLQELKEALKEELELETDEHMVVCTRNAISGKVYPLQLGLPPNKAPMNLVLVSK